MANIPTYTNPIDGLKPSETGVEAYARTAYRINSAYREAGSALGSAVATAGEQVGQKIDDANYREDVSRGMSDYAAIQNKLTRGYQQAVTDSMSDDPATAAKGKKALDNFYQDEVQPAYEGWQQNFSTQRGRDLATTHAAAGLMHWQEKVATGVGVVSGVAANKRYDETVNLTSNTINMDPTPAQYSHSIETLRTSIDATVAAHTDWSPEQAAKFKEEAFQRGSKEYAFSFVDGLAKKGPAGSEAARTYLESGMFKEVLNAQEVDALRQHTIRMDNMRTQDLDRNRMIDQHEMEDKSRGAMGRIMNDWGNTPDGGPGPNFRQDIQKLVNHDGTKFDPQHPLRPQEASELLSMGTRLQTNGDSETDQALLKSLITDVAQGKPVTRAQVFGYVGNPKGTPGLKREDADWFVQHVLEPKIAGEKEATVMLHSILGSPSHDVTTPFGRPGGTSAYNRWRGDVIRAYQEATKQYPGNLMQTFFNPAWEHYRKDLFEFNSPEFHKVYDPSDADIAAGFSTPGTPSNGGGGGNFGAPIAPK